MSKSKDYKVRLVDGDGEVTVMRHREVRRNGNKVICVWEEPNYMEMGSVWYERNGKTVMHATISKFPSFKKLRDYDRDYKALEEIIHKRTGVVND